MKKAVLAVLTISLAIGVEAKSAFADTLYTSGSSSYNHGPEFIINPFYVTDSFVPTESGTTTSVEFVAWILPGGSLSDVSWSIGTTPDGSNLGNGTVDPSATYIQNVGAYGIYTETFSTPGISLTAGDSYYLTLYNAMAQGDPVEWDVNDNSLTGYQGGTGGVGAIGSETFEILGTASAVTPEPSSFLLLGTGIIGLGLALPMRRRLVAASVEG